MILSHGRKKQNMHTIAAIDAGSNAIRMVVGRLDSEGRLETVENVRLPVRLGQDAFTTGQFSEATIQMAVTAFLRFRKVAQAFEVSQTRAVATSAVREASNSDILIDRIAQQTGFQIEVISGDEEARLVHLAVKHAIDLRGKHALLVDIGGGSVEVTLSDADNVLSTESYEMGTVRLLRKLGNGASASPFHHLIKEYAQKARRRVEREIAGEKVDLCIGTGGNVEEMGKLRKRLFKRDSEYVISVEEIGKLIDKLSALSIEERIHKLRLRADRADVLLPAAVVLHMIAQEVRVKEVYIPGVGLKDGLLLDMAPLARGPVLPRREQVWASAMRLGQKYRFEGEHSLLVARLAVRLFNQTLSLHRLTENELLLLETAALLHDIGHFINTIDHHKHGYYLLKHNPLIGLNPAEQEIVANIVRYHRKEAPSPADENFKSLPQKDRLIVTKLCAILRLADALDSTHTGRVKDVRLEQRGGRWHLQPMGAAELRLEKWDLEKRKTLFQEVFGVSLEIEN